MRKILKKIGSTYEWVAAPLKPKSVNTGKQPYGTSSDFTSISLGCHPDQVDEYNAAAQARGIKGAWWDRGGICHLSSRRARNEVMEMLGMFDRDGGYGDRTV